MIEPWVFDYVEPEEMRTRVGQHLTVLPKASLNEIKEHCATGSYTHVHILAHGVELKVGDDTRYGLALHDRADPSMTHKVEAATFAKALRPPKRNGESGFARPVVVTLAACDAGNSGSVVGAGASIAHALHDEGIPLVVASQFPLSFAGSVVMTKVLYEGLLAGRDPRSLLVDLRRELKTQSDATHDWASIVAYAALPPTLESDLTEIGTSRALRRLDAALSRADRALRDSRLSMANGPSPTAAPGPGNQTQTGANAQADPKGGTDAFAPLRDRIRQARDRINQKDPRAGGAVASADKRLAEMYWRLSGSNEESEAREYLLRSRERYYEVFRTDPAETWALVQALVLTCVLGKWPPHDRVSREEWELARLLSEREVASPRNGRYQGWALTNLIELYLISPSEAVSAEEAEQNARKAFDTYLRVSGPTVWDRVSTMRQLWRYKRFFVALNGQLRANSDLARDLASSLAKTLPDRYE